MTKKEIENFLIDHPGYLKKSPLVIAERMWRHNPKYTAPKNEFELGRELKGIKKVLSAMRYASESVQDTTLSDIYKDVLAEREKARRFLYWDIEVSPDIVLSWSTGYKLNISYENIIQERAIICICYKWSDDDKVHSLQWDNGDDKAMLKEFSKVLNTADVVCGHNLGEFDLKWVRTRCLLHGIELSKKFQIVDTLSQSRSYFKFNSNRLDYISKFLGNTGKEKTEFGLWKKILMENDKESMDTMVSYCCNDVSILEKVHKELSKYVPDRKFKFQPL